MSRLQAVTSTLTPLSTAPFIGSIHQPEGVEDCLDILGDMTLHSTLPEDEFNKELEVIRREMAMGDDNPGSVTSKLLFSTEFQAHPCRFPVIGHREVFDQVTHDDLIAFYKKHYVPNNLFVVVTGPVEPEKITQLTEKIFGDVPRAPFPPIVLPTEPNQQGSRIRHLEGKTQHTQLRLAWHGPTVTHPDCGPLDLFATILGSGRSSRLFRKLREENALVHSIAAYVYAMTDTGMFVIGAEVDAEKREEAEAAIQAELAEALENGITASELDKALKMSLGESLDQLTTTRGQASDIGSSWMLTGNAEFTGDYIRLLQSETPESVQAAAKRWLDPKNVNIVSLNPEGSLAKTKAKTSSTKTTSTERIELSNGTTLLLRPDARLPLVTIHAALRGGLLAEPSGKPGVTRLFSKLLTRDTKTQNKHDVSDRIESVGGEFSSFSGYNSFGLNAEVMAPDWELGLQTLASGLTEPAFAAETVANEREFQIAAIKSELDRPMTIAGQKMRQLLFPGHAYENSLTGTAESMEAITIEDLTDYQKSNILGKNLVLSVYGDVDGHAVRDRAEELLGKIDSGDRLFKSVDALTPISETKRAVEQQDKEQAIVVIAYPTGGLYDNDALTLELIDDACSDMSSRLYVKIREELGAAYMVGTSRMLGFAGGCFYFYVATAPEMAEKVESALIDEIAYLAKNGIDSEEFIRAKRSWHGSHKNRLQSLAACSRTHSLDELYDFGWDQSNRTPAKIDKIDENVIREATSKYFADTAHAIVRVSP